MACDDMQSVVFIRKSLVLGFVVLVLPAASVCSQAFGTVVLDPTTVLNLLGAQMESGLCLQGLTQ